jgi:arylformamidase
MIACCSCRLDVDGAGPPLIWLPHVFHDCTIPVSPFAPAAAQTSTFGLPLPAADRSYSVDLGASCNCPIFSSLCAHSNGTHTECAGHVLPGAATLASCGVRGGVAPAVLITVAPEPLGGSGDAYAPGAGGDLVVSGGALAAALAARGAAAGALLRAGGALCVRTPGAKRGVKWAGAGAPYFTPAAAAAAAAAGARHLLTDLPSLDREADGGALLAHRAWWALPPRGGGGGAGGGGAGAGAGNGNSNSVTELCDFPEEAGDGVYVLALAIAPWEADAAPSRVWLHPCAPLGAPENAAGAAAE